MYRILETYFYSQTNATRDVAKKKLKFDCTRKSALKLDTFSDKNDDSGIIKPLRGSSTPINIIKPRTGVK